MPYVIKMTDIDGDEFWQNHAYRNTWGSEDMAQVYEDYEHAILLAVDMPSAQGDKVEVIEI